MPANRLPTAESAADDVGSLMDTHGLDKAHIVGHSMGGWVALELLRRRRALSVIALCPGAAWPATGRRIRLFLQLTVSYGMAWLASHRAGPSLDKPWVRRCVFHYVVKRPELLPPAVADSHARGAVNCSTYFRALRQLGRTAGVRPLPPHRDPVRVVWSENDLLLPATRFRDALLERIGPVEETTIGDAGHLVMWEKPEQVARILLDTILAASRKQHN